MVKLKPHEVDFVAGGETRLMCTAEASPPARIRWRRRGREIRATDRIGNVIKPSQKFDYYLHLSVSTNLNGACEGVSHNALFWNSHSSLVNFIG